MTLRSAVDDPVEAVLQDAALEAEVVRLRADLAAARARVAELELLADRDPLTPVLNRRAFLRELNRTMAYCQRYSVEASLVFFDLDGFKSVNDRFGHAAGDQALKLVASTLSAHVRESDVVGRLGGDEFGVILAQANREAAEVKARALVREIEMRPVLVDGRAIALSSSFGVRSISPGAEAAEIMAQADAAMFVNKGRRRGAAPPLPPTP
jgi:diguanylate cyclase (GGDEF)-like protein